MSASALLACVCWPMVLAAGLACPPFRGLARMLAPWAALPAMLAVPLGAAGFKAESWLLGTRLGFDDIAIVLLPVTAGLWLAAGLVARRYLDANARRDRFFGWFLAAMSGNLLLLAALDVVTFYFGFALMSLSSYGLIVHAGDARARHAGRYYIVLVMIGEVCVITALMMLANRAEIDFAAIRASFLDDGAGRNDVIVGLLFVGFGVKAGIFGLHFWLPLAHPVAPAPASAVLSGAMIKAGLVGWMRLLPMGELALPSWGTALALLGLFTAYYAVFAGLPQREAKTVLAYSSVSQMGVMTLVVGLGMVFPAQWPTLFVVLLLYMVHHSLVKGGLFLGAGLVQRPLGHAAARVAAVVLSLGALALAGGPLTSGLIAKLALKTATGPLPAPWNMALPLLLSASGVLTALLMLRFLWIAWPRGSTDAGSFPVAIFAPWLAIFVAWLTVPWWLAEPALRHKAVGLPASWDAAWPVALAAALAIVALRLHHSGRLAWMPLLPAGDLGIPLERKLLALGHVLGRACNQRLPRARESLRERRAGWIHSGPAWAERLSRGETHISSWSMTGLLVLVLAVSFAWLLL